MLNKAFKVYMGMLKMLFKVVVWKQLQFFGIDDLIGGRRYNSDAINQYVAQRGKVKSRLAKLAEAERGIQHHASGIKYVNPSTKVM